MSNTLFYMLLQYHLKSHGTPNAWSKWIIFFLYTHSTWTQRIHQKYHHTFCDENADIATTNKQQIKWHFHKENFIQAHKHIVRHFKATSFESQFFAQPNILVPRIMIFYKIIIRFLSHLLCFEVRMLKWHTQLYFVFAENHLIILQHEIEFELENRKEGQTCIFIFFVFNSTIVCCV